MTDINTDLPSMLFDNMDLMKVFNKNTYAESFKSYCEKYRPLFDGIESGCNEAEDSEKFIKELTDVFVSRAGEEEAAIKRKSDKDHFLIDHNLILTVYVLPALMESKLASCENLAGSIVEEWNRRFPRYSISIGRFEDIDAGFKRKLCYITTAVCNSIGKDDNCYELTTLRDYRDNYLLKSSDGEDIVNTYYNIAPTIVNRINKRDDSSLIYRRIFDTYINPCISLINSGELDKCKILYSDMVYSLKDEYM